MALIVNTEGSNVSTLQNIDGGKASRLAAMISKPSTTANHIKFKTANKITIVDAVMGRGKSSWMINKLREGTQRTVVVLSRITEVKRYEAGLEGLEGVVSLAEGNLKTSRFSEALSNAQVILTTHKLYEDHLLEDTLDLISKGNWHLVIDEVPAVFSPVKGIGFTDADGLLNNNYIEAEHLEDNIIRYYCPKETYNKCMAADDSRVPRHHKDIVKKARVKDLFYIDKEGGRGFFTFNLQTQRISAFKSTTIMTYLFSETDLAYWCYFNNVEAKHKELVRDGEDFKLVDNGGVYSGSQFADLIEIVKPRQRGRGTRYGEKPNHFSATESKKLFNPESRAKESLEVTSEIRKSLRSLFRKPGKDRISPEDFMFTCRKESIKAFVDGKNGLTESFIGENTWVPFNERAVNGHGGKHHLAFLYNVFPFTSVKESVEGRGVQYNDDRYALSVLLQWIWRSAIRNGDPIKLYLPSSRMRRILTDWLEAEKVPAEKAA